MEQYGSILLFAIPIFLVMIIFEYWYGYVKKNQTINIPDAISSLYSGVSNSTKDVLQLTISLVSYEYLVRHLALFKIESSWILYILAFVIIDFKGYWTHRLEHRINIFWNRHAIHHSSEEFNLPCALRQSISSFFNTFFWLLIPAAILGIPSETINIVLPIHLFLQFWYHTQHIRKMGWLEKIIVTPSHHRVHHAINSIYLDKNFGQIFIFWDKWFRTFQEELDSEPAVYGIKRPAQSYNPIAINFQHLWLLIKDALRASSFWDKFRIWWMPTGWRPEGFEHRYPVRTIQNVFSFEKFAPLYSPLELKLHLVNYFLLLFFVYYFFGNIGRFELLHIYIVGLFVFIQIFTATEWMNQNPKTIIFLIISSIIGILIAFYIIPTIGFLNKTIKFYIFFWVNAQWIFYLFFKNK